MHVRNVSQQEEKCVALHTSWKEYSAWWDNYCMTHENPAHISWKEFTKAFCELHIPKQSLANKVEVFRLMTQGTPLNDL